MKKRGKRIVSIVSAVIYLIVSMFLIGCPGLSKGMKSINDKTAKEQIAPAAFNGKALSGNLELQIFVGGYGDEFWKAAIETFKKENPGINVIVHMGANVNTQMKTRWMSDNPPDFAYWDGPEFPYDQLVADGKLMDLKAWFDTTRTADGSSLIKDNIYKGLITEKNSKVYSAPYIFATLGMWYDAKLFRDNNIKVPGDFNEFLKTASVLKSKGVALMIYPGVYPAYLFEGFFRQGLAIEGGKQIFEDINTLKPGVFVSKPFLKAMKKLEVLSKTHNGVLKGALTMNHIKSQLEWLDRKAAFIPNGLWLENEMKGDIPSDFEMTFIPSLIQDKGQKYIICSYSNDLCLAKNGHNPEAAKAWLAFLYREDILKKFTEVVGIPTVYKMDLSDFNVSETIKNVQKYIADPNVILQPTQSTYQSIVDIISNALNLIVKGKLTATEACKLIQKETDKISAERKK